MNAFDYSLSRRFASGSYYVLNYATLISLSHQCSPCRPGELPDTHSLIKLTSLRSQQRLREFEVMSWRTFYDNLLAKYRAPGG